MQEMISHLDTLHATRYPESDQGLRDFVDRWCAAEGAFFRLLDRIAAMEGEEYTAEERRAAENRAWEMAHLCGYTPTM